MLIDPKIRGADRRVGILDTARNGGDLEPGTAHLVRVIEYNVIDREGNGTGEVIVLLTNIVEPGDASADELAAHNPLTGQRGSWRGDRENSYRQWWRRG